MAGRFSLRYRVFWQAGAWLLLGVVVWLSLTPAPPQPPVISWDKAQHALAYAVLTGWFVQAWERRADLFWAAAMLAVGIGLEYIQGLTGYRDFDYDDMLADGVGVCLALLLVQTVLGRAFVWVERLLARERD